MNPGDLSAQPANRDAGRDAGRDASHEANALADALWRIYRRPARPALWLGGGNLPWNDPDFGERMLREHLDDSHGAASRRPEERSWQLDWLWRTLALRPGCRVLDLTCGPGLYAVPLAERGCHVRGVDFNPAAVDYARELAQASGVAERCAIEEADVRHWRVDAEGAYDAALLLYGQLAVFPPDEARRLLRLAASALRPGGRLCLELLDPSRIDRRASTWWFTDDRGLWGERPFLHLGERFWDDEAQTSTERFLILHLETGALQEIVLNDRAYDPAEMTACLEGAGFEGVRIYRAWDGGPLADAAEWLVYIAERGPANPRAVRP